MDSKNIQPMTQEIFDKMVESHELWLKNESEGHRADFTKANLTGIDMRNRNLTKAIFDGAVLTGANMSDSCFYYSSFINTNMNYCICKNSDFSSCKFILTSMAGANFYKSNLNDSDFIQAFMEHTKFREANFAYASFYRIVIHNCSFPEANFFNASFSNTRFDNVDLFSSNFNKAVFNVAYADKTDFNEAINVAHPMACPSDGEFIGWKKCCNNVIVKLKIPADAKRSSAFGMKCRTNKAEVLEIQNLEGEILDRRFAESEFDPSFTYTIGEIVEEPNFCEDRWKECAPGIHFFVDRKAAVDYEW